MAETWQKLMDKLNTLKQRRFVEAYVKNQGNGTEASKAAQYQCNSDNAHAVNAARLLRNPKIAEVIAAYERQIRAKTAKKIQYSREDAARDYDEAIKIAKDKNNASAMCTAISGKVELFGLQFRPAENPANTKPMTRVELETALRELDEIEAQAKIIQIQVNKRCGRSG